MDPYDSESSSSFIGDRMDGVNRNFQKSEDQMIINIMDQYFEGKTPCNKREYAKFSRLFHDDKVASQYRLKLPYFRDPNSLRRRLLMLQNKRIMNMLSWGPDNSDKAQVLRKKVDDSQFVQNQMQVEQQKKKRKLDDNDDDGEYSFWDHPKVDKLFEFLGSMHKSNNNSNSIKDFFSHKKALEELKDMGIIDDSTFKERVKELAIKFSIL